MITGAGFALDYFEARHAETLAPVTLDEGRPGAHAGGREDRHDAPDRQYRGVRLSS